MTSNLSVLRIRSGKVLRFRLARCGPIPARRLPPKEFAMTLIRLPLFRRCAAILPPVAAPREGTHTQLVHAVAFHPMGSSSTAVSITRSNSGNLRGRTLKRKGSLWAHRPGLRGRVFPTEHFSSPRGQDKTGRHGISNGKTKFELKAHGHRRYRRLLARRQNDRDRLRG